MEIQYKTKKLKENCLNLKKSKKIFGEKISEKISSTIYYLEQALTLKDIFAMRNFNLHKLKGNLKDRYAIDLGRRSGIRLIIKPLNEKGQEFKSNEDIIDIENSTRIILIMEVSNHYE